MTGIGPLQCSLAHLMFENCSLMQDVSTKQCIYHTMTRSNKLTKDKKWSYVINCADSKISDTNFVLVFESNLFNTASFECCTQTFLESMMKVINTTFLKVYRKHRLLHKLQMSFQRS